MARKFFTDIALQGGAKVTGLPTASSAGEAVPFEQFNAAVEGISWKQSCRVATQSNIDLSSPGATIDGVTMSNGDRVLVRAQTLPQFNGIYTWTGAATSMTRTLDASTFDELEQAVTSVEEGTDENTTWRQSEVNGVLETDPLTWSAFGTSAPAASETTPGLIEIATQGEVDAGTDAVRAVTPQTLAGWSGRKLKYSANVGDGVETQYTLTHNLNSRDVTCQVYTNSGNYDTVECDVERMTVNTVRLTFSVAPASNAYRAVVIG